MHAGRWLLERRQRLGRTHESLFTLTGQITKCKAKVESRTLAAGFYGRHLRLDLLLRQLPILPPLKVLLEFAAQRADRALSHPPALPFVQHPRPHASLEPPP